MSKIAVVFWTGTGNTSTMATSVVEGIKEAGAEAELISATDFGAAKVKEYDGIAFGCPAMGDEVLEDMLSDVKTGDKVDMKLAENDEGKIITGTVVQLADKAEKKDGDTIVMAKIKVDQGYEYLKSGLSVDIYLNDSNTKTKDVTKEAQGEE